MLPAEYTVAQWVEYPAGALALIALLAIIWRLSRNPRRPVLGAAALLVGAGALSAGMHLFLGTRLEQVRLDAIRQVGLELHHAGLRTNALVYDTQVSVPVTLKPLPSAIPGSGAVNAVAGDLVHKTTTVQAQIAAYGLIDFSTVDSAVAAVDRQARTITLTLPDPAVSKNTTYILSVAGVQLREGPLTAVMQSIIGPIKSLIHQPVVSVNPGPALTIAQAEALSRAQRSVALQSCGKEEIVQQLTDLFRLIPAYRGYAVRVLWPVPPDARLDCAALQAQFAHAGR